MLRQDRIEKSNEYCSGFTAVVSALLWLAAAVFGILVDANGICFNNLRFAIFRNKSNAIYNSWMTDITPPKWTFAIWEFVYTWNMLWVCYCVANICRPAGKFFRENSFSCVNLFPVRFHVTWCMCSLTHIGWMLLWDREAFVASLFVQAFVVASCVICLVISHKKIYSCGALLQYKRPWDLWVARTLIQNGVTVAAVWNSFLFTVNVVVLLVFQGDLPMHLTSTVALAVFGLFVFIWFILDVVVFDKWLRYTFTFYPAVAWAMCGVLSQHFHMWTPVTIAALVVLGIAIMALIVRVPVVVWRSYSYPLYVEQTIPHKVDIASIKRECVTTIL